MTEAENNLADKYGIDIKNNAAIIAYVRSLQSMTVEVLDKLESIDFLNQMDADDLHELDGVIEECCHITTDILENHMAWDPLS